MAIILASKECELREILLKDKPEHMLKISPKGTVPVLKLANKVLDESLDIISWAMEFPSPNMFICSDLEECFTQDFIKLFDSKFKYHLDRYKYSSRYEVDPKEHREECKIILDKLEAKIKAAPWIFGLSLIHI